MDLNVCIETDSIRDSDSIIRDKIERCRQLGFHTIALSVYVDLDKRDAGKTPTSASKHQQHPVEIPTPPNKDKFTSNSIKIYTRLTAKVSQTIQIFKLGKHAETSNYDLLALEPENTNVLKYITTGSTELDILTFNMSDRMDFKFFTGKFKLLEDRGVCIEINYGPAQLSSSLRRNIICNGQSLVEKTQKNVILSSGIDDLFRLRGPKDAMSLGVLFMIPAKKCYNTVYTNGKKALDCAKHRANPISSAIEEVALDDEK